MLMNLLILIIIQNSNYSISFSKKIFFAFIVEI